MDQTVVRAPTKATSNYVSRESGRPTKIEWSEAKAFYLSDPKITLQQVAEKFGTTYKTVQRWSAKENWIGERKNKATESSLDKPNEHLGESVEEINKRHTDLYLQMQGFIKTSISVAHGYTLEKYRAAEKTGKAVDKQVMYSAQNVKYLMEALKIAVDGERVAEGITITGPTKSEKDIKVSGTIAKYDSKQIEAMFAEAKDIAQNMSRKVIDVTDE